MPEPAAPTYDHDAPADAFAVAAPLVASAPGQRRTAAEEARTIVATNTLGTLSTLTPEGDPWGSFVAYAQLPDGAPVLCVSTLAEHGRNLLGDTRASFVVVEGREVGDPLDSGRVTLAGRAVRPEGDEALAAREAFLAAVPASKHYIDFGDFSLYVLRADRVRWVGGYGRMDSTTATEYRLAEPDPVAAGAAHAATHMNEDHADALLLMARHLAGFTDATAATCQRADRYGLDLWVTTPRGKGPARVSFAAPCTAAGGLRAAAVELTQRARAGA